MKNSLKCVSLVVGELDLERGNPEKDHSTGVFSDELQHPPRDPKSLCAHNETSGTLHPYVQGFHGKKNHHKYPPFSSVFGKSCCSLQEACRQASRQPSVHIVSLTNTPSCHPRKQQTSTWEQSRASQPAPPPPTLAEVTSKEVHGQDGLLKGFPNSGPGTSTRPLRPYY